MSSKIYPLNNTIPHDQIPNDQVIVCSLHDIITSLTDDYNTKKTNFLKQLQDQLSEYIEKNGKDPTTLYLKNDDYNFLSDICKTKLSKEFQKSTLPITFFY